MGLFKRSHVRGMAHELTVQGVTTWPSKTAEEEAADAVADDLDDTEVPEVTDESGLSPEEASVVVQKLVEVADQIAQKTGGARDLGVNKEAASLDYRDAAAYAAANLMQKAAEETAMGPEIPGTGTPSAASGATAETAWDASRVPSAALVGPPGTTDFSTAGASVGKEQPQGQQPGAVASEPTGEVAKLSSLLKHMAAMDGASLSGGETAGTAPAARKDLADNLVIPGAVAKAQGASGFEIPEDARVGVIKKQPAGTPGPSDATPNAVAADVKSAAAFMTTTAEGRELLRKLSAEAAQYERKEAAVSEAVQLLAQRLGR